MSRHFTSCHEMSRQCHVMSTSCHVMPRDVPHVTSWHVMSRHVISRNVTSSPVMSTSCHEMLPSYPVMSRHVISSYVISRRKSRGRSRDQQLHCQLTSSTRSQFKLSMTVFVGSSQKAADTIPHRRYLI